MTLRVVVWARMCVTRVGVALFGAAMLLGGCSVFDETEAPAPTTAAPITGCQQQAQAMGFQVVRVDPQETDGHGDPVVPVLVNWGQNGGVHLLCRTGPNGTVTLG
jgi:hypothetical protein